MHELNKGLHGDLQKTKKIADILQGTVETLANRSIMNGEQRANFQKRFEDFLTNQELTLDHFSHSLMEIKGKLRVTQEALQTETERFRGLLARQEDQIDRAEKALENYNLNPTQVLNKVGLFSMSSASETYQEETKDFAAKQESNTVICSH